MNNTIVPFNNSALGCSVRTITIDEEPWFVGKDVCAALGYANETDAMNRHCKGVVKRYPLQTPGGVQEIRIINEPDMMRLICGSKLESAKRFEAWVFEEVLPTIRKHGIYATGEKLLELISKPENAIKVFQTLKDEQDKRKALEAKIEEDAPYTEFGKSVEVSAGCMLIGEFAKVLAQNGREIGQNRLFELLRNEGILGKTGNRRNVPSQEHVEAGRFRVSYRIIQHASGRAESKATPYLTPKGQVWLLKRMTGNKTEQKEDVQMYYLSTDPEDKILRTKYAGRIYGARRLLGLSLEAIPGALLPSEPVDEFSELVNKSKSSGNHDH